MGKGGKGELGWLKAFPAQKFIHLVNIHGVLSVARPPAGVGDTPVPRGRLMMEVHRDSVTVQVMRSVEEEPLVGLGEGWAWRTS